MEYVNHPNHYKQEGRKECIVEMQDKFGSYLTIIFCLTNSYKYLYRAGNKEGNSEEQDIAKARWYYDYAMSLYKDDVKLVANEYKLLTAVRKELKRHDKG